MLNLDLAFGLEELIDLLKGKTANCVDYHSRFWFEIPLGQRSRQLKKWTERFLSLRQS